MVHCRVASLAVVLQTAVAVVAFLIVRACLRAQMQQRSLIAAMRGVVVEGGCVCAVIWSSRFLQCRCASMVQQQAAKTPLLWMLRHPATMCSVGLARACTPHVVRGCHTNTQPTAWPLVGQLYVVSPSRGSEVSKAASSVALSALCCMLLHAHVWQLCVHRAWLLMCRLQQIVRVAVHVIEGYISSSKFRLRPHDWGQGQGC